MDKNSVTFTTKLPYVINDYNHNLINNYVDTGRICGFFF